MTRRVCCTRLNSWRGTPHQRRPNRSCGIRISCRWPIGWKPELALSAVQHRLEQVERRLTELDERVGGSQQTEQGCAAASQPTRVKQPHEVEQQPQEKR